MAHVKTICFDLDGVVCNQTEGNYARAVPNTEAVEAINRLYDAGHKIIIVTSRFMGRNNGDVIETYKSGYEFTLQQLKGWRVKFHELHMGKPRYDVVVDDRAIFFENDWPKILKNITDQNK